MTADRSAAAPGPGHRREPHAGSLAARLNWLRAGVLGANDGIVSTAGLVIGVAAATTDTTEIAVAGLAGLAAGAVSMALGEYVSVSTQRDTERALIDKERRELQEMPAAELRELVGLLRQRGLSDATARRVADELTAHDALAAHLEIEIGLDRNELTNPRAAAASSALAFSAGAVLPLAAILLPPAPVRVLVAVLAVLVALTITGIISARLGGAPPRRAVTRLVVGGGLAMAVTFVVGQLLGGAIA
jgi:VIT1/CCC1 family predicted Fe2+/Mn2+ transporter